MLGLLGVAVAAQNSTVDFPQMNAYAVVDQRTLDLSVFASPCSWTRITRVEETPTEVRVRVETLPCPIPGPGTAELVIRELTVSLVGDLGARSVMDSNGQAIPQVARPEP